MFKKEKTVSGLSADCFKNRRYRTLKHFAEGQINILVSSDSTGRGVDIPDIDCVINYDPPKTDRTFVHRAGRTARAGKLGTVLSFVTKQEVRKLSTHKTTDIYLSFQRMVFKKILAQRGYWDNVIEAKKEDISGTKDRVNYKKALDKLQATVTKKE